MKLHTILKGQVYQRGAFDQFPDRLALLRAQGIGHVINLSHRTPPDPELVDVLAYDYFPFGDNSQFMPHMEKLEAIVGRAVSSAEGGTGVLTHCWAGRNRSGFVNALIVRRLLGVPGEEALAVVRSRRPNAVDNKFFEAYLLGLPGP